MTHYRARRIGPTRKESLPTRLCVGYLGQSYRVVPGLDTVWVQIQRPQERSALRTSDTVHG